MSYIFEYKEKPIAQYYNITKENAHFIAQGICIGIRAQGRKKAEVTVYTQEGETKSLLYIQQ